MKTRPMTRGTGKKIGRILWIVVLVLSNCHYLSAQENINVYIQQLLDQDPQVRADAAHRLGAMGENAVPAVPALVKALEREEEINATKSVPIFRTLEEHAQYHREAQVVTRAILIALGAIGKGAISAVPAVIRAGAKHSVTGGDLEVDPHGELIYREYSKAVVRMGETAIPHLLSLLSDSDYWVKWLAMDALGNFVSADKATVSAIMRLLDDPEIRVRCKAIHTLGKIGPAAVPAIPGLIKIFEDESSNVYSGYRSVDRYCINPCYYSAVALGEIGSHGELAKEILPVFQRALASPRDYLREFAAIGIEKLGPKGAPAVPLLIKNLDEYSNVRAASVNTLGSIGEQAAPAVPDLIAVLSERSGYRHPRYWDTSGYISYIELYRSEQAAITLGKIGEPAVPALLEAMADADPYKRARAIQAYIMIRPLSSQILTMLIQIINSDDHVVSNCAQGVLDKVDEKFLPVLIAFALDKTKDARFPDTVLYYDADVTPCLLRIKSMMWVAIPMLVQMLEDDSVEVRTGALWILIYITQKKARAKQFGRVSLTPDSEIDPRAVPLFAELLSHEKAYVRSSAAHMLINLGEMARPAIPELVKACSDKDRDVRAYAAIALGRFKEEFAIPLLLNTMLEIEESAGDPGIRKWWVVWALKGFGAKVLPDLENALDNDKFAKIHPLIGEIITQIRREQK